MNKKKFASFKDTDIYSLSMFMLYKLKDIPEYTVLSELPYVLDKDNMLKFCQYFGGRTIKVPTVKELYSIMYLLLLYEYVNIEGMEYQEAIKLIGYDNNQLRSVKSQYNKLCKVLEDYNFNVRGKYE